MIVTVDLLDVIVLAGAAVSLLICGIVLVIERAKSRRKK